MGLEAFATEIESISGVQRTEYIEDDDGTNVLRVVWFGEPADYSTRVRGLRNDNPTVVQVEAPDGEPTRTGDAMPIEYYAEE